MVDEAYRVDILLLVKTGTFARLPWIDDMDNKETTIRQEEIVNRLKQIKEELLAMKDAFDAFAPKV